MNENEFHKASTEVALTLAASHIQGTWEERLPLMFDAALTIGCVTELTSSARKRPLSEGFSLTDLKVVSVPFV